jgi:hypothetical protein
LLFVLFLRQGLINLFPQLALNHDLFFHDHFFPPPE